jgi:iron complex transport system ATP-binding protein
VLKWVRHLARQEGMTVIFTSHHPHHALAVADDVMLMLGPGRYVSGLRNEVMSEEHLAELYGVTIKLVAFEYMGRRIETFAPVF